MADNLVELEAAEWLARLDRADASVETRAAFERWKNADSRHSGAFARLEVTWQELDRLQGLRPPGVDVDDPDILHTHARAEESVPIPPRVTKTTRPRRGTGLAVAATALVALGVTWFVYDLPAESTYVTTKGGFQQIVLSDRSTIQLNTDTEVIVAMLPALREVKLIRGEASFDLTHDSARPFVVVAGDTAVRAVGTRFDVRRLDGSVEVTVNEGRVAIGTTAALAKAGAIVPASMPTVGAGETAVAGAVEVKMRPISAQVAARKLAWQDRTLAFDAEPLAQVVAEFNRYNDRQLVIRDPTVASLKIGGYFRPTNLDAFVSVLESNFGIRTTTEGRQLVLESTDVEPK